MKNAPQIFQSPSCRIRTACFVQPMVQNLQIFQKNKQIFIFKLKKLHKLLIIKTVCWIILFQSPTRLQLLFSGILSGAKVTESSECKKCIMRDLHCLVTLFRTIYGWVVVDYIRLDLGVPKKWQLNNGISIVVLI